MHQVTLIESKLYKNGTHTGGGGVDIRQDETQIRVGFASLPL